MDPHRLDAEDLRRDYGERRRLVLGAVDGRLFAVAYAPRGRIGRLISARMS